MSGTNTAFFDNDGNITEIQLVASDITELKETRDEYKSAKEKAEDLARIKSVFLGNMSHEIRTPLNGILGFSSLLRIDLSDKEKLLEYCNLIEESGNRLLNIMDDILEISLLETRQITLKNTVIYLPHIMSMLFDYLSKILEESHKRKIKIKKCMPESGPNFVTVDGIRLYQIFIKLLHNATKFTDSGSIEFGYWYPNDKTIRFFVRDTGIGIFKDRQDIIFEIFRQADDSIHKTHGGMGLGLSIAKGLVENMGSRLQLDSDAYKGSLFYFDYALPGLSKQEKKPKTRKSNCINYDWSDKKILIVEDIYINFILLREYLKRTKAIVLPAHSGHSALKIVRGNEHIDLVLLDIRLPDMNGYEVAKEIKKLHPGVPIVAQTAYTSETDEMEALQSGCDGFLIKPIPKDMLLHTIDKLFANKS